MANDFVRNIKGVRNINKLSRNITTENDLISTHDNEVYVVTNDGYKKITGGETEQDIELLETDVKNLKTSTGNNTSEIETLKTSTGNNTSEIETLKTSTDSNTSEIETLKTSTGKNTSEIETLKTSTSNNETNIDSTQTLIEQLQTQIDGLDIPTDVNKKITITNWEDINIKNNYIASDTADFKPSYCVVDYGSHKEVFIRFGFKNLVQSKNVVGSIPSELVPHKMYRNGTTTIAKIPPKIVITTSGDVEIHQYTSDEYISTDYVIYQGSWIIKEDQ